MKRGISLLLTLVIMLMVFSSVIIAVNATDNTAKSYKPETTTKTNENHGGLVEEPSTTKPVNYSKPTTPKASTTNAIDGIQISWNKVAGATKYNVYRRQAGYKTWTLVGTTTSNTLLDKNVKSGVYYCYSVRAYNSAGKYSDYISSMTSLRKYMAVPKLTGISNATNGLYIKWNAVPGVTNGYRVYRRGAGQATWTYLGTTKNTYYTDTAVKNRSGEYFRYTVIADGGYHSKFDTTGLYLLRLSNPTFTIDPCNGFIIDCKPVKGATSYNLYRKTANSNWKFVTTLYYNEYENNYGYQDWWIDEGVPYTYAVKACKGNVTSSYYTITSTCYRVATG